MTNTLYPTIHERQRPVAVSYEADFIRRNIESSHSLFIGQSVFVKRLYKQQLKEKFELYNSIWQNETLFSSSISDIINNSAYRSIISLGKDVIQFMLDDLRKYDNHWFYALEALTGENPIKENHKGIVPLMKKDWLDWAKENYQTDEN